MGADPPFASLPKSVRAGTALTSKNSSGKELHEMAPHFTMDMYCGITVK